MCRGRREPRAGDLVPRGYHPVVRLEKPVSSMNATLEIECPKCGGGEANKLRSAFGIQTFLRT
jgi:hypothetical protein